MGHQSGWFFIPDDEDFHFTYHPDTRNVNKVSDDDEDGDGIISSWDGEKFDTLEEFEDFCIEKMEEES